MFGICVALAKTCLGLLTDCDEVYNYWEVLHLFTHGYGLQTWEYSYKLRSISYIWLKYLFFLLYEHVSFVLDFSVLDFSAPDFSAPDLLRSSVLPSQKTLFFYSTKALLALSAWYTHRYLYQYLLKKNKIIARYTYLFTLLSPGFFHSDIAFLPSSFSMLFVTLAFATQGPIYVLLMAIATLWGWPFCALLGLPRLLYLVFTHRFGFKFLRMAMLSLCFALPILAIDYYYYGELFFAPWNIVAYNIFGIGPNVFGTEPWYFYFVNLFLNFNVVFVFALLSFPLSIYAAFHKVDLKGLTFQIWEFALWFITLSLQSHKEERFMYVVYPIICFNAAYSVHVISLIPWPKLWLQIFKYLTIFCFLSFSMLRIVGQYSFYGSATTIYNNLKDINPPSLSLHQWKLVKDQYANSQARYENRTLLVCLGDEWYRFPSHYFLKEDFRIGFIKGGFKGLLPKYFKTRSHPFKIEFKQTRVNNLNKPEEDRWVDSQTCDYFIGLDKEFNRPRYVCMDFLDKENTHAITRAFYLGQAKWQSMCIFTR